MLICRNTEGVRGNRKVGNPCFELSYTMPSGSIFTKNRKHLKNLNRVRN